MHWYLEVMKKYAVFSGRARRKEYWMFQLVNGVIFTFLIVGLVIWIAFANRITNDVTLIRVISGFVSIYFLAVVTPGLAVSVRRLHDINFSGWWMLIGLVPAGGLVLLIFHVLDSNPGANQYGPNPKGIEVSPQVVPYATAATANATGAASWQASSQPLPGLCRTCAAPVPTGTRFCPQCGTAMY